MLKFYDLAQSDIHIMEQLGVCLKQVANKTNFEKMVTYYSKQRSQL